MRKLDLTGQRFGRLMVIEEAGRSKNKRISWECVCDCGETVTVVSGDLTSGHTQSCGCLNKERSKKANTTHGMRGTSTYQTWADLIKRCNNPKNTGFKNYGGRGIKVCKEWLRFEKFFKDMGEKPANLTIERVDNNKGYYKGNCKYATSTEQNRNQRIRKDNKSGTAGVWYDKELQKYQVNIRANYKQIYIGLFANLQDAKAARKGAELKYWE
jgi:hypothetical protein